MTASLSMLFDTGQTFNVTLPERAEQRLFTEMALERARLQHRSAELARTYHLGDEPTPGLDYDDRLTVRLKSSAKTLYKLMALPEKKGGLRSYRVGRDYRVTEQAVLDYNGDKERRAG